MTILASGRPRRYFAAAIAACSALLILFGIISYSAVLGKSATYDEPLHVVAGFIHKTQGDFRINPEDPALFGYLAALPHRSGSLKLDFESPFWQKMIQDTANNQWAFSIQSLYRTPGNDADAFVNRSRLMFVMIGVALGAMIAIWAWQLAGAKAAIIATALFALDPNFTAHAGLVKNDVLLSLAIATFALGVWRLGRRGNIFWLAVVAIACAAAVNVKFSGLICGPLLVLMLVIRAVLPRSWEFFGITITTAWRRLLAASAVCLAVAIVCYISIWACYRFRFAPTDDPNLLLNTPAVLLRARTSLVRAYVPPEEITQEKIDQQPLGPIVDAALWLESKRLLPQPWLFGFLYTRATTYIRSGYLLGDVRDTGWWYYFPCAMVFKTPTATLFAIPLALIILFLPQARRDDSPADKSADWWTIFCLALAPLLYGASAMAANLNLGFRHILPIYPFIFIMIALGLSRLIVRWNVFGGAIAVIIIFSVGVESLAVYPNYIPFFNALCGGPDAGIDLLGDSNLDWGQDLKLLANWRKDHLDRRMYLAYFGTADPQYYHIDEIDLPFKWGGWPFASHSELPTTPHFYLAISATHLQYIYMRDEAAAQFYEQLRARKPLAVLGKSIYVFEVPPR